MTTTNLLTVPEAPYLVQTVHVPFVGVPAGTKLLIATLTRVGWPAGLVMRATITWSDGEKVIATFNGGSSAPAKAGIGVPTGLTSGTIDVDVLQALTTAISVDAIS